MGLDTQVLLGKCLLQLIPSSSASALSPVTLTARMKEGLLFSRKTNFYYIKLISYCLLCIWNDLEEQSHALLREVLKPTQQMLLNIVNIIAHAHT